MGVRPASMALLAAFACSSPSTKPDAVPEPALRLEYVAHACFRLHAEDGTTLLIDPYASKVWLGYEFPEDKLAADGVLITHPHYDHDKGEFIGEATPWSQDQLILREPGTRSIGSFAVTGVEGKHADPWGMEFGQLNTIWLIEIAGLRLIHLGDNGPLSEIAASALGQVDVLLAPIDGNEHILSYAELESIRESLNPSITIPMHYRLPDLESDPDSPEDLGPIEPWLETQSMVQRVEGNELVLRVGDRPAQPEVWLLQHSAAVSK